MSSGPASKKRKIEPTVSSDMEDATPPVQDQTIRGIVKRDSPAWNLFRNLARGDFQHDFGENEPGRDKFVPSDASRFFEIAKNVSSKGKVKLLADFNKIANNSAQNNLFKILKSKFDENLVPPNEEEEPDPEEFFDEVELLNAVGVVFDQIKNEVRSVADGTIIDKTFSVLGLSREYTICSSMYRLGERGQDGYNDNRNVSKMFETVTGGKKKFAIIVDASGGLPLTELLNTTLRPEQTEATTFYILENIENTSDSATKLTNIKPKGQGLQPDLRFLKDDTNTVVYPLWDNSSDQKSNIYSKLKIVLNRISDDEVEANILLVDNDGNTIQAFNIGDVANSSNVKNASLYALAVFMEKGLVPEAYVYTLIKRMGDWCQALSLLDRSRKYKVLDINRQQVGETTLQELSTDTEIGIVTNDRILLAYSILLGLNVFYTSAMDIARLIYFKNKNDLPSGDALETRANEIFTSVTLTGTSESDKQPITEMITEQIASIQAESDISSYIRRLKNFLSNAGRLRYEFDALRQQYATAKANYEQDGASAFDKFNAANICASIVAKLRIDTDFNTKTIDDIRQEIYPGSQADTIRLGALQVKLKTGARIMKSIEVTEAKNILLGVRDDIRQVLKKGLLTGEQIRGLLRSPPPEEAGEPRSISNIREILTVTPTIGLVIDSPLSGGGQDGGATKEEIKAVYNGIRTKSIRLLESADTEQTSTVNIYKRGDKYIDEKLNAYTVTDEYIVTAEDLTAISKVFNDTKVGIRKEHHYVILKGLVLLADIETQKLELLFQQGLTEEDKELSEDIREPEWSIPGTVQYEQLQMSWQIIYQLERWTSQNIHTQWAASESTDPLERLNNIRTRIMEHPSLSVVPADLTETATIQTNFVNPGRYREEIPQRLIGNLRLNDQDMSILGHAIETAIIEDNGNVVKAVSDWMDTYREGQVKTDILALVETVTNQIRTETSQRIPLSGVKRPRGFGGTYRAGKPKRRHSTFRNPVKADI
jgi:hypothetical protein